MIDLHQKFDFHEAVEVCRLMEPFRPFCVEDPVREEQFRTQIPKLRLLTTAPLAPGEEWGTRAEFSPLVEQRDIDFARASLPNVGGITEMLKIMAVCDTHQVGIVPLWRIGEHPHVVGAEHDGPGGGAAPLRGRVSPCRFLGRCRRSDEQQRRGSVDERALSHDVGTGTGSSSPTKLQ